MPERSMTKGKIVILSVIFIFLTLIMMEIEIRALFKITHKDIEVYRKFSFTRSADIFLRDEALGYKLIPHVSRNAFCSDFKMIYTTNGIGLREKEIQPTLKFKILFLGDSLTFGEGVPIGSRFSDILENEFSHVYSINAGVPGYGIHQMFSYLKNQGLKLKPDLVICSIIEGDCDRAIYKDIDKAPHLMMSNEKRWGERLMKLNYTLMDKSYLYSWLRVEFNIARMSFLLKERDREEWQEVLKKGGDNIWGKITVKNKKELVKQESFRIFSEFKDSLGEAHVDLLVVNLSLNPVPWL